MTDAPTLFPARTVITMDPAQPRASAILVDGDRIAAVGEAEDLRTGDCAVADTFADAVVSDSPTNTSHTDWGWPGRVAGPEQRVSVHDALRAVTIEAAYSWRMEHELGSITAGKAANFTVLGEDPYEVDPQRLNQIPVLGTVYGGRWFPAIVRV